MSQDRVVRVFAPRVAEAVCAMLATDYVASLVLDDVVDAMLRLLQTAGCVGAYPSAQERAAVRRALVDWFEEARTRSAPPSAPVLHPAPEAVQ